MEMWEKEKNKMTGKKVEKYRGKNNWKCKERKKRTWKWGNIFKRKKKLNKDRIGRIGWKGKERRRKKRMQKKLEKGEGQVIQTNHEKKRKRRQNGNDRNRKNFFEKNMEKKWMEMANTLCPRVLTSWTDGSVEGTWLVKNGVSWKRKSNWAGV